MEENQRSSRTLYVQPPALALASLNFTLKSLYIGKGILLQVEFPFGENPRFLGFN